MLLPVRFSLVDENAMRKHLLDYKYFHVINNNTANLRDEKITEEQVDSIFSRFKTADSAGVCKGRIGTFLFWGCKLYSGK